MALKEGRPAPRKKNLTGPVPAPDEDGPDVAEMPPTRAPQRAATSRPRGKYISGLSQETVELMDELKWQTRSSLGAVVEEAITDLARKKGLR